MTSTIQTVERSEAGMAYVMLLIVLVLLFTLALAFLLKVGAETSATLSRTSGMQAGYLAESAANHAKWRLLNELSFPADEQVYYMHSFANGRYGYKVRRHTDTTFATIATVAVVGDDVFRQSYVLYVKSGATVSNFFLIYDTATGPADTLPWYRSYDATTWSLEATTVDVQDRQNDWVDVAADPLPSEIEAVMGVVDKQDDINLAVWDGTAWGNQLEFSTNAKLNVKCFDIAYEHLSGEALVVGRNGTGSVPDYTVWGYGATWIAHTVDSAFGGAYDVFAADIDGDGDLDILGAADKDDDIAWWENTNGLGTTWTKRTVDGSFRAARAVYAADIDGDGDLDVLGASKDDDSITWWENTNGLGTLWSQHTVDVAFKGARDVYAADIDGDGDLDVLGAAEKDNEITWWENTNGLGTAWTKHTVDAAFQKARSVYAADVDGDNDLDILGAANKDNEIAWWENTDGLGTLWTKRTLDNTFAGAQSVYAEDIDGDGDLDVLGASKDNNEIAWWENTDGSGTSWIKHTLDNTFTGAQSVFAADINGDGLMDVLGAAKKDDTIRWWEQTNGLTKAWVFNPPIPALDTGGSEIQFVAMASNPTSDEILIAILDKNKRVYLLQWNGTGFTNLGQIESSAKVNNLQVMDIAYEQISGHAVIVWGDSASTSPRYRIWDGATLSAEASLPSFGRTPEIVQAAADPTSDYIFVGALDGGSDLNVAVWDGTTWIDSRELETSLEANNKQVFDVAWEDSGNDVLVVWAKAGSASLRYAEWTKGTSLNSAAIQTGPNFQANPSTMQAFPLGLNDKISIVVANKNADLYSSLWDGGVFVEDPPVFLKANITNTNSMSFDGAVLE